MNESYDLANHLLVIAFIVFYWHLLRIWHQPPPPDRDDKKAGKEAPAGPPAGPAAKLAGVALRELAPSSAEPSCQPDPAPAVSSGDALAAIRTADGGFDEKHFLAGAALAYEHIVNAYAEEDMEVLEKLLDSLAAAVFADAIEARRARGERSVLTFIGIKDSQITDVGAEADLAEISVRFVSEAITSTYAADGALVEGDPEQVVEMTDRWTFARRLTSKDPNWKLIATEGA